VINMGSGLGRTLIVMTLALCGCNQVSEVKVAPNGEFSLAARSFLNSGSRAASLKEAMKESERHCAAYSNTDPWITKINYSKLRRWSKSVIVTITFFCLGPDDPRIEKLSKSEIQIEDHTNKDPDPFAHLFKQPALVNTK